MSRVVPWLLALAWVVSAVGASAQSARIKVDRGPHYLGDPIRIRVVASGFEEEPQPEARVPAPQSGRLELVGVSPNVKQSISIVDGRMSRTRQVTFVYEYRYLADESGAASIGPIRIVQGQTERVLPPLRLNIRDVPSSDAVGVELRLPEGPVFVGQRVPVTLSFRVDLELQENLQRYALRAPLFDMTQRFRFVDPEAVQGETSSVSIETEAGRIEIPGRVREELRDGRPQLVVSVERTLVPLQAGRHEIVPSSLVVDEGTAYRRDFFGGRTATRVRKWRARDVARRIEVVPLPEADRPASFAGAIGRGLRLDVAADRTVVRVGDPITLTFTLRGEGLDTASLPRLDAEGLLPAERFRVPAGNPAGVLEEDAKRFTASVRVLDETVEEIPALAYSWFDPQSGRYETTRSRPIALSVRSAEIIGAADVESDAGEARVGADEEGRVGEAQRVRPRSFALTGADLAIVRDPARLLRDARDQWGGGWLLGALYAGPTLLVGLAWLERRRRERDPALVARQVVVAEQLERVRAAAALPGRAALAEIAEALRRLAAEVPEAHSPELDALLGRCDEGCYAPPGQEPEDASALQREAEAIARRIAERTR